MPQRRRCTSWVFQAKKEQQGECLFCPEKLTGRQKILCSKVECRRDYEALCQAERRRVAGAA